MVSCVPPLLLKKKEGIFHYRNIFPARELFLLQFYINSEKSPPGEITVITVLSNSKTIGL